jgi:hypothetical protein
MGSCARRRQLRELFFVKNLRHLLSKAVDEASRHPLQKHLLKAKEDHYHVCDAKKTAALLQQGRVIQKKNGAVFNDPGRCLEILGSSFAGKWAGTHEQCLRAKSMLIAGEDVVLAQDDIFLAAFVVTKASKIDAMGICRIALCYSLMLRPAWWCTFFNLLLNSWDMLEEIIIASAVLGKSPGAIERDGARALLPQPVLLEILEFIQHIRVTAPIAAKLQLHGLRSRILAGLPGAQPMDVCFSMQILTEVRADNCDRWSIARSDIKQYYDQINPRAMIKALVWVGVDKRDATRAHAPHGTFGSSKIG